MQVGANIAYENFVFGALADFSLTNIEASMANVEATVEFLCTVRARAGYELNNGMLAYAHGGFAFGKTHQDVPVIGGSIVAKGQQLASGETT